MAKIKWSAFPSGTTIDGADFVVGEQSGVNVIWTWSQVLDYVGLTVGSTGISGGTTGRLLYDNGGVLGETAGVTFPGAGQLALAAGTITTSQPGINLTQTWNAGGVTFTGVLVNITKTASADSSPLLDVQLGGSSLFSVETGAGVFWGGSTINNVNASARLLAATGGGFVLTDGTSGVWLMADRDINRGIVLSSDAGYSLASSAMSGNTPFGLRGDADTFITRAAAASLRLGKADAASPVAQTLQVQSVVAGTTDAAGADFTIKGSAGTGTGDAGKLLFKIAPNAAGSGSTQNSFLTAFSLEQNGTDTKAVMWQGGTASVSLFCGGSGQLGVIPYAGGPQIYFDPANCVIQGSGNGLNFNQTGGDIVIANNVATPAHGSTSARLIFGTTAGFGIYYGSNTPTVSAAQGSLYLRSDGSSTSTRAYINTDGGTTWTAIATAA